MKKFRICDCEIRFLEQMASKCMTKKGEFRPMDTTNLKYYDAYRVAYEGLFQRIWETLGCAGQVDFKRVHVSPVIYDVLDAIVPPEWKDKLMPKLDLNLGGLIIACDCNDNV